MPINSLKRVTNLQTWLGAILIGILGIALMLASGLWGFLAAHANINALVREFGALMFSSVAVYFLWELAAKRAFLNELREEMQVAESVHTGGVIGVGKGEFLRDFDWPQVLTRTSRLQLFVSYARSWRNTNRSHLLSLAQRKDAKIEIFLPDPDNGLAVRELADRYASSPEKLETDLREAITDFTTIFGGKPCHFALWLVSGSPLYSFYRFDNDAIIGLYKHRRDREYAPPSLRIDKGGAIWDFLDREIEALKASTPQIARQVYPAPSQAAE